MLVGAVMPTGGNIAADHANHRRRSTSCATPGVRRSTRAFPRKTRRAYDLTPRGALSVRF